MKWRIMTKKRPAGIKKYRSQIFIALLVALILVLVDMLRVGFMEMFQITETSGLPTVLLSHLVTLIVILGFLFMFEPHRGELS